MLDIARRSFPIRPQKTHSVSLPSEIFHIILGFVLLDDIVKLICINAPLYHTSIRDALAQRIQTAQIVATNRLQPSLLEAYKKEHSFADRSAAEYMEALKLVHILKVACPHAYVTISYYIASLRDMQSFWQTVRAIPMRQGLRYSVELDFDPGILHVLDLLSISGQLNAVFGGSLKVLRITNFNGDLLLDMAQLALLEALWITNTNVFFASLFEHNLALKHLVLHPNYDGFSENIPITIDKSLPPNLKLLRLGQSVVVESSLEYSFPDHITDVSVMTVRDILMKYMQRLFEQAAVQRDVLVYQSALAECSGHADYNHIHRLLKPEHVISKLGLTSIRNEDGVWDFSSKPTLRDVKISKSNVISLVLPPGITHLDVSNNNIVDVSRVVFGTILEGIVSLNISDNPICWGLVHDEIVFPTSLEHLLMNNTNVGDTLERMVFGNQIRHLSLEVNQIRLVGGLSLTSPGLDLSLACNLIGQAPGHWVPPGTTVLRLTENFLSGPLDLSRDSMGRLSCVERLYLSNNHFRTLSDIRLPETLRIVNLDECSISRLENVEFPPSVEELSINGCDVAHIHNVGFGVLSNLQVLSLAQNRLTQDDLRQLRLPESVFQLNLGGNHISQLSRHEFAHLPHLRTLSLSWNRLEHVDLHLNASLEALDLSYNNITSVQLRFPEDQEAQLAELNLSMNMLKALTPAMIGHGVLGTQLAHLLEIDVAGNKVGLHKNLHEFPDSLMCVVEGVSGIQDRYGYDVGANLLGNTYCLGKRIDVPSL